MKKSYFMLAATAALFAACAETDLVNEVNVVAEPQAIGFETFAQKATRAEGDAAGSTASTTALDTHHESFTVWASKQLGVEDNVSYSTVYNPGTVTITNKEWVASPLKFWDKAARYYYFYAAAPTDKDWEYANKTEDNYSTGYLTLADYTLVGTNLAPNEDNEGKLVGTWKNETSGDKDLMIAGMVERSNATFNSNSATNIDKVHFTFRHILSKLNIKVKGKDLTEYGATITLNTLDVYNLNCKGTFSEQTTPCWSLDDEVYTLKMGQDELELDDDFVYTHEYLVMPQTVNLLDKKNVGVAPPSGVYLHIRYTITTGSENNASSEVFETYYGLADIFGSTNLNLNEGSQNTLAITISPDVIEFEVETEANGWDNQDEPVVEPEEVL